MTEEVAVVEIEVQPEATPEPVAPAPESTPEQESEKKEAEKTFTQDELNKIIEKRLAKERRQFQQQARLEAENIQLKERLQAQEPKPEPKSADGKPTPDSFGTYEEYLDALTDWKIESRQAEERKAKEAETAKAREADNQKRWNESANKAREKYADFDDVIDQDLPISKPMLDAILDSDIGSEIAYHLGKNPAEAERIAQLGPIAAAREIGKLEVTLSATPAKVSNAPAPIKPVGTRGSATNTDLSKASMEEYIQQRKKSGASWARR